MKELLKPMLFILLLTIPLISCNKEELFVEPILAVEDPIDNEDTDTTPDDTTNNEIDTSLPCDFTLDNVQPNSTIIINCVLDLEGKTANIPANVTIIYEGGEIINGTLNFGDNGIIGGELLNSTLTIGGSNPQVKDPIFSFVPNRWGIVEGKVSDEVAKNNKDILKSIISQAKELGVNIFVIDKLDAYFKIDGPLSEGAPVDLAIQIPSNFTFRMSENTHLRVQPNATDKCTLLSVYLNSDNAVIEGGNLYGDRDEHDYSDGINDHGWGHLFTSRGSTNVTVRNVTMIDAAGDALKLEGEGHAVNPDYAPTRNFLATGCKFIRSRRNNLSITAADGVVIEDCDFIDAGIHTDKSQGTIPGFALDIEALKPNELSENIIIRNNRETGSRRGGFLVAIGDKVTFEGNVINSAINLQSARNCIVRNNIVTAQSDIAKEYGAGIITGRSDRGNLVYSNTIYNNTVNGFSTGISISNFDMKVYGNTINNCNRGMSIGPVQNSEIYENTIISNVDKSAGISMGASLNNVVVRNNDVNVMRYGAVFANVNNTDESGNYTLTFKGNNIVSGSSTPINSSHGIELIENTFNNAYEFYNCSNLNIIGNTIESNSKPPFYLRTGNSIISIKNNIISKSPLGECIKILEDNNISSIILENNSCN
ncbi:hypothetical protein BFR04_08835 [Gaetbulibacter sp. 4G1]|nr:right-handed parallel beta-helix repeat-containing protein [Gaetbulibacter sp. 4G1]PIA77534.1 hypothetical protein BFR04_08835 [Gaetbulibacter sp. 4G1]